MTNQIKNNEHTRNLPCPMAKISTLMVSWIYTTSKSWDFCKENQHGIIFRQISFGNDTMAVFLKGNCQVDFGKTIAVKVIR